MEICTLNRLEEQWMKLQLKAMCLYNKAPGNKGLPDSLSLLQQCLHEREGRLWPPVSPLTLDDESTEDKSIGCLLNCQQYHQGEKHQRRQLPSF
jgi:hypothetical protein